MAPTFIKPTTMLPVPEMETGLPAACLPVILTVIAAILLGWAVRRSDTAVAGCPSHAGVRPAPLALWIRAGAASGNGIVPGLAVCVRRRYPHP